MTYKPVGVNESSQFPPRVETHIQAKIDTAIAALINGAPGALDTLKELADTLASDESAAAALASTVAANSAAIALKLNIADAEANYVQFDKISVGLDTDGVPYWDPSMNYIDSLAVLEDTDGTPYVETGP